MPDELKEILRRELEELKQNKIRVGALAACAIVLLIVAITEDGSDGEEIILDEPPPVTEDLPTKIISVPPSPDGVKIVLGATADRIFIGDPFETEEEIKFVPPPQPATQPAPPLPIIPAPSIPLPPPESKPEPQEQIILLGTAISGENKTAMFLRGNETLFKTIGEEIGGRTISDITPDFVAFTDGRRIYLQKELN